MAKTNLKKKRHALIISCIAFILILLIAAFIWIFSVKIYKANFDVRFESYEPLMLYTDDFDGLQRTKYQFASDKGQILTGYCYSAGEDQRGIVIMAHGLGGTHNSYMDCADFFAQNGYYVFAYDATGCGESEGHGVGGLPQGVIDLEYAIHFVKQNDDFPDLPIVLFGHSWGGYSVSSVLTYQNDIKAVIECSGHDSSAGIFEAQGKTIVGNGIYLMMPFIKLHEAVKYGKYAANTAMDGFNSTDAAVMIVHGADDKTVPSEYGYDIFYEKYKNDPRFKFLYLEDKGHNYFNDNTYVDEFNAEFDKWLETLNYDYIADENKERFIIDKAEYINNNLDRTKWCNRLDTELFSQFLEFYDSHIK